MERTVELTRLADCMAAALDYAFNVLSHTDSTGIKAKRDKLVQKSFAIVKLMLDMHGHKRDPVFALPKLLMGLPPRRTNLKRRKPVEPDPYANDPKALTIRNRLQIPQSFFQLCLAFLRRSGVLTGQSFPHVRGRGRHRPATAWQFGSEIARLLSAAFFSRKNQKKVNQNKSRLLSDFLRRGLGKLAQMVLPFITEVKPPEAPPKLLGIVTGHEPTPRERARFEAALGGISPGSQADADRRAALAKLEAEHGPDVLAGIPDAPEA